MMIATQLSTRVTSLVNTSVNTDTIRLYIVIYSQLVKSNKRRRDSFIH